MPNERQQAEIDKYREIYDDHAHYRMGRARMSSAVRDLADLKVTKGSYLDVGCGRGEMLDMARILGFNPVAGIDPVALGVPYVTQGLATELPWLDNSFDVVTMLDVMEHLPEEDCLKALEELVRVAKQHVLVCIANYPHEVDGKELHITRKPYEEWDKIIREAFPAADVEWLPNRGNISETWRISK